MYTFRSSNYTRESIQHCAYMHVSVVPYRLKILLILLEIKSIPHINIADLQVVRMREIY